MIYSAREARQLALDKRDVFDELAIMEPMILDAITDGHLEVTIGPDSDDSVTTGFTNSSTAYQAYSDPLTYRTDAHKKVLAQMNEVISHFQSMGYTITREKVDGQNKFNWLVSW